MQPFDIVLLVVVGALGGLFLGLVGGGSGLSAAAILTYILPHIGVPETVVMHAVLATSLGVVTLTAIASATTHARSGNVDWRTVKFICPASLVGVIVGAHVADALPTAELRIIFAVLLLLAAARMLFGGEPRKEGHRPAALYLVMGALVIGFLAALIGASGGVFMVPFLNFMGLPVGLAAATSVTNGLPLAITGTLSHIYTGWNDTAGMAGFVGYLYWPAWLALGAGGLVFAPLGARLQSHVPATLLKRAFAILIIAVAIDNLLQ